MRQLSKPLRILWVVIALAVACLSAAPAWAVRPDEVLSDPALEARARALSVELRCLVCQNESIDASDSDFAHDIRVLLRQRLTGGDTDQQAIDFLVARYGQFILLKPEFNAYTALLWLAPGLLLIGGAVLSVVVLKRRRLSAAAESMTLTDEEQRQLAVMMNPDATAGDAAAGEPPRPPALAVPHINNV